MKFYIFAFLLSYFCCSGVTLWNLQKSLQYIIVEFTPPSFSLPPHSWNSFINSHFSIVMHEYRMFPPHWPFYTLCLYLPNSYWYRLLNRTSFIFLFPISEKKIYLRQLYRKFHCDFSMYVCIITSVDSSTIFIFSLP
jgi:hypothetical protein